MDARVADKLIKDGSTGGIRAPQRVFVLPKSAAADPMFLDETRAPTIPKPLDAKELKGQTRFDAQSRDGDRGSDADQRGNRRDCYNFHSVIARSTGREASRLPREARSRAVPTTFPFVSPPFRVSLLLC